MEESSGNNRKKFLVIIGAVVLIIIAIGIAYFVFAGSQSFNSKIAVVPTPTLAPGEVDCGIESEPAKNSTAASKGFICFAKAAKNCGPATLRVKTQKDSGNNIILDQTIRYRMENAGNSCHVSANIEASNAVLSDTADKKLVSNAQKMAQESLSKEGSCSVDPGYLTSTLIAWAWGRASETDLTKAPCTGNYFNASK
jgi:hypothetical protein